MKKAAICIIAALILYMPIFGVYADDENEINMFYNFDGYNAAVGSGIYPDGNWTAAQISGSYKNYGGHYDDETQNYALKVMHSAESSLLFNDIITSGKLHVSFMAKLSNNELKPMFHFYDGRDPGKTSLGVTDTSAYGKTIVLNGAGAGTVQYYYQGTRLDLACWTKNTSEITADFTQWHRFDLITSSMSSGEGSIDYYIDGIKVNSELVQFGYCKGFKSFSVRVGATDNANENDYMLLDNVRVRRYFGDVGVEATINGGNRVSRDNPSFEVVLSEGVDMSLLTEGNITIKNTTSGMEVSNFEVLPEDEYSFKIKINESLSSGIYNVEIGGVTGNITGMGMMHPAEFRTEYKSKEINSSYINFDFSDYTTTEETSCLPNGWYMEAEKTPTNLVDTDQEGEKVFGVKNGGDRRRWTRYICPLDTEIPKNTPYDVYFKVNSDAIEWQLCLMDETQLTFENGEVTYYDTSSIVISVDEDGKVICCTDGESGDDEFATIPVNAWNDFKLCVTPKTETKVIYTLYNGDEMLGSPIEATRNFGINNTVGLAIAYKATNNPPTNHIYIDDVHINAKREVIYPEVEEMSFLQYDGTELNINSPVTTAMSEINVYFNTFVNEESAVNCTKIYEGDSAIPYTYSFNTIGGKSVLCINIEGMLEPSLTYSIVIDCGIESGYTPEVKSEIRETRNLFTKINSVFNLFENSFNEVSGEYSVKFAKNDDKTAKFLIAVAAYETVSKEIDGSPRDFKILKEFKYIPVVIEETDKGIFEYKCKLDLDFRGLSIKSFLVDYPKLITTEIGENGEI